MSFPQPDDLGLAHSLESYVQLVLGKRPEGTELGWFFRGQAQSDWELKPKIDRESFVQYRENRGWDRHKHEQRLLDEFMRGARAHARIEPKDPWEWLALAQHSGLATRLLDWTANPLAALYFAVEERSIQSDSAVWCYHHSGRGHADGHVQSPFFVDEIIEFRPAHVTPRITVQGGCFTVQPDPQVQRPAITGQLRKITIPKDRRPQFRDELRKLGIDRASLFPDLDGIAFAINCHLSSAG